MAKIGAVFLLAYLLFGTVAGDWAMHGPTTAGYGVTGRAKTSQRGALQNRPVS